jgi:hypothetical protein
MPDARVTMIPNGWHHPWLAKPQIVGRLLLDFLAHPERSR